MKNWSGGLRWNFNERVKLHCDCCPPIASLYSIKVDHLSSIRTDSEYLIFVTPLMDDLHLLSFQRILFGCDCFRDFSHRAFFPSFLSLSLFA